MFGPPDVDKLTDERNVWGLIKALRYRKDERLRKRAAQALVDMGTAAVPPLIATLLHHDKDLRGRATEVLGRIGDASTVGPLTAALRDHNDDVRRNAAKALVRIGPPAAVSLISAIKESDGDIARAMVEIGAPAVKLLVATLGNSHSDVRLTTAEALERIGWQPEKSATGAAYWIAKKAWDNCISIGVHAVDPLLATLKDDESDVREAAAKSLGQIGDSRAVEALAETLEDDESDVREAAAEALERIGWQPDKSVTGAAYWIAKKAWDNCISIGVHAVDPLIATLKDDDPDVREAAAKALGQIGDSRAVEPLIAMLDSDIRRAAVEALEALGQVGDAHAVETFRDAPEEPKLELEIKLNSSSWYERKEAAVALAKAGSIDPLIAALKDEVSYVRMYAAEELGKLGDTRALNPLLDALNDTNGDVSYEVIYALGRLGDERAVNQLQYILSDSSNDVAFRTLAADALGDIGGERAFKALHNALSYTSGEVRETVEFVLSKHNR